MRIEADAICAACKPSYRILLCIATLFFFLENWAGSVGISPLKVPRMVYTSTGQPTTSRCPKTCPSCTNCPSVRQLSSCRIRLRLNWRWIHFFAWLLPSLFLSESLDFHFRLCPLGRHWWPSSRGHRMGRATPVRIAHVTRATWAFPVTLRIHHPCGARRVKLASGVFSSRTQS